MTHYTEFSTADVLIHRVAALVRLYEAGHALELAATIDPAAGAALAAERRANYLLDLTEAHNRTGGYRQACSVCSKQNESPQKGCAAVHSPTACCVHCSIAPRASRLGWFVAWPGAPE